MSQDDQILTHLKQTTYLGSHPSIPGKRPHTTITFFAGGVQADAGKSTLMSLRWDEVLALVAEDRESQHSRVTLPRLLFLGWLAPLVLKRQAESYVRISDAQGDWIFAIPDLRAIELEDGLRPLQERISSGVQPPEHAVEMSSLVPNGGTARLAHWAGHLVGRSKRRHPSS